MNQIASKLNSEHSLPSDIDSSSFMTEAIKEAVSCCPFSDLEIQTITVKAAANPTLAVLGLGDGYSLKTKESWMEWAKGCLNSKDAWDAIERVKLGPVETETYEDLEAQRFFESAMNLLGEVVLKDAKSVREKERVQEARNMINQIAVETIGYTEMDLQVYQMIKDFEAECNKGMNPLQKMKENIKSLATKVLERREERARGLLTVQ